MIETAYGKMYLSEERIKEYIDITSKHLRAMMLELKEHKLIPGHISLEKTTVRELDYYNAIQQERLNQHQNKSI